MTLVAVGFATWNYMDGRLSPEQFQMAVTAAIVAYVGVEGAVDFATGWGSQKEEARLETEKATVRALKARQELRQMLAPAAVTAGNADSETMVYRR